jgi:hypothetical protein
MALAGCRTMNKGITEAVLDGRTDRDWHIRYGSHGHYSLNDEGLATIEFEGLVDAGRVRVRYQRGLQGQARCIADVTGRLLAQVERQTGVTITTSTTLDLLRFDEPPENFDIQLTVEPNEFPCRCSSARATSPARRSWPESHYPYVLVHELVETSLAARAGGRVLPDLGWGAFGLKTNVNNYTRWFRDGLANYAGYVACEELSDEMNCPDCPIRIGALLHASPFSELRRPGTRLFTWSQSSPGQHERAYYNAALGLFLLIENRFGQQVIRDIVAEIARQEAVDGRDLRKITSGIIGIDVRQLVTDFQFPATGVELPPVTRALAANKGLDAAEGLLVETVERNSTADRAGLLADDVIVAADSAPVVNTLDFELALLRAGQQPAIDLAIWRKDAGTISIELPLEYPDKGQRIPGKRLNPLKKGRIDFFGALPFIP